MAVTVLSTVATGGTSGAELDKRLREQTADRIFRLGPALAPLTWVSRMARKRSIGRQEFNLLEDKPLPRVASVSGSQTPSDTSIEVSTGQGS